MKRLTIFQAIVMAMLIWMSTGMVAQIVPLQRTGQQEKIIDKDPGVPDRYLVLSQGAKALLLKNSRHVASMSVTDDIPALATVMPSIKMRLDSVVVEERDENGAFAYAEKLFFIYDQDNRDIGFEIYERDADSWEGMMRNTYSYDDQGRRSEVTVYEWSNQAASWVPQNQSRYAYPDPDSWEIISYFYEYGDWHQAWKEEYYLDQNGRLEEYRASEWNMSNSSWDPMERLTYTYDQGGKIYQIRFAFWDPAKMAFVDNWMYEYHYNPQGMLYNEWFVIIDPDLGTFFTYEKTFYFYDPQGRVEGILHKAWNEAKLDWIDTYRRWNEYDAFGNLAEFGEQYWEESSQTWVDEFKDVLTYNNDYDRDALLLPTVLTEDLLEDESWFNHMLVGLEEWSYLAEEERWYQMIDGSFFYTDLVTGNSTYVAIPMDVYPSPASEVMNVDLAETGILRLCDLSGKLLIERQHFPPLTQISVANLQQGMYLLEFTSPRGNSSRIIMVQPR